MRFITEAPFAVCGFAVISNYAYAKLRTVHSFDPCMACAVHLYDEEGKQVSRAKVLYFGVSI
jgi:hypothetical protein